MSRCKARTETVPAKPARGCGTTTSCREWGWCHGTAVALFSGTLVVLAFPPGGCWPLIFVSLAPLLAAVFRSGLLRAFVLGCASGTTAHLLGAAWLVVPIGRLQGWGLPGAALAFTAFAVLQGAQFGVGAAGAAWVVRASRRTGGVGAAHLAAAAIAAAWIVSEQQWPRFIPWSLADALAPARLLRQTAALSGSPGLSFLIVFVNALVAQAVFSTGAHHGARLQTLSGGFLLLTVALVYGAVVLRDDGGRGASPPLPARPELEIAVVQGGVGMETARIDAANWQAWSRYSTLTRQGPLGSTQLVVWPETVLRSYLRHRGEYRDRVTGLAREIRRPLLVGALDLSPEGAREMNAAYLVQPVAWSPTAAEGELDVYHKRHLLPFGERLPAWGAALGLHHWRTTGRFVAGTGGRLRFTIEPDDGFLEQRSVAMAPAICFEATRAGAFNAAVRSGAGFLVNLSDDSWFANSHGPDQHLQAVVLRAVETRRWLVRASNSGISAFIDPTGQVVRSLPLGATGLLRHRIAIEREMTPYVRWGDWFLVPCLLTVFAAVGGRSVCARWRHWRGSSMHARPRQGTGCVLRSKSACGIEDGGVIDEQRTA